MEKTSYFKQYMTLENALMGKYIPEDIRKNLVLLTIPHLSFLNSEVLGELVVHKSVAHDIPEIFSQLKARRFPVMKMTPVVFYNWSDNASMEDNNTSAFNYRTIADTDRLSNHSFGLAIDINPRQNPYVKPNGEILPIGSTYNTNIQGTITPEIADIFRSRGWVWGGDWESPKDWQHFEKPIYKAKM